MIKVCYSWGYNKVVVFNHPSSKVIFSLHSKGTKTLIVATSEAHMNKCISIKGPRNYAWRHVNSGIHSRTTETKDVDKK